MEAPVNFMAVDFWSLRFVDLKDFEVFLCFNKVHKFDQNFYDPFEIKISQPLFAASLV